MHGNKQEYEWLRSLVGTPEFADRVDDVVMEFGNSLYQKSVDRYIAEEDVPIEQVQKAWRNTVGAIGAPSSVSGWLYEAVRETNMKRRDKHQMRVICGDPYIDWDKVQTREDIEPYLSHRDQWFTQVVKDEVLAKHHRALLVMGWGHFPRGQGRTYIEPHLRKVGAKTYLIVFGTNVVGGYDDLDHRFDSWPAPVIVPLSNNWVGELPAFAVVSGGDEQPHGMIFRRGSKSPVPETRRKQAFALKFRLLSIPSSYEEFETGLKMSAIGIFRQQCSTSDWAHSCACSLAWQTYINGKPSHVEQEGFGSSPLAGDGTSCAYSGLFSVHGVGGGPPMPCPCIMPGPIDSMFFCIRSMWVTTVSHISTLVRQSDSSFGSLIVRTIALI